MARQSGVTWIRLCSLVMPCSTVFILKGCGRSSSRLLQKALLRRSLKEGVVRRMGTLRYCVIIQGS